MQIIKQTKKIKPEHAKKSHFERKEVSYEKTHNSYLKNKREIWKVRQKGSKTDRQMFNNAEKDIKTEGERKTKKQN